MNAEINLYWIWLSELLGGDPPAGGPGKEAAQRQGRSKRLTDPIAARSGIPAN